LLKIYDSIEFSTEFQGNSEIPDGNSGSRESQEFPNGNSRWPCCACAHDMSVRQIQVEVTNVFRSDRSGSGDIESAC